ncbi:MAG: RuBisCO large subunit C-terminal-like domain-containing protein [Actinobacteria bacterium]|nr:RuBisCO large subunit C-terminal-like domain-containing protein [Actinomycetota bacterium]
MFKQIYDSTIFDNDLESIGLDDHLIVTYYFENSVQPGEFMDHLAMIQRAGLLGATGSWADVKGESKEVREKLCFKIIGYFELPSQSENSKNAVVQIAYPIGAFTHNIPNMLQSPFGNVLMFPGRCRVLGINFPKNLVKEYKGPKFGIDGVRRLVGEQKGPLLLSICKPKMGLTAKQMAEQAYQSALGGANLYKDDEALTETWNCSFDDRIKYITEALGRANEKTGKKTLYLISITDEVDRVLEKASRALEGGVEGVLLCCSVNWSILRVLAENKDLNSVILYHLTTVSLYLERMTYSVFCKISRLCGADIQIIAPYWGTLPVTSFEDELRTVNIMKSPFYDIKPSFPMMDGGIYPGLVPALTSQYGLDMIYATGSGVHGHPDGTAEGCRAFIEIFDLIMEGKDINEKTLSQNKALARAIDKWGLFKRPLTPFDGLYNKWSAPKPR